MSNENNDKSNSKKPMILIYGLGILLLALWVLLWLVLASPKSDKGELPETPMTETESIMQNDTEFGGVEENVDESFTYNPDDYDTEEVQKLLDSAKPDEKYVNMTSTTIDLENDAYTRYDAWMNDDYMRECIGCPASFPVSYTLTSKDLEGEDSLYYTAKLDNTNVVLSWSLPVVDGEQPEIMISVNYGNAYDSQFPCVYFENGVPENALDIEEALSELDGYWFTTDYISGDTVNYTDTATGQSGQLSL